jgi:Aspartyl/Asparaginyl beta-hydroxylase
VSSAVRGGNASESYQGVQLKSAASILALLWRHRDNARLQNLLTTCDDSYEHEVFQQSDRRRVVFILDLPHPELLPEELEFLEEIMRCSLDRSALEDVFEKVGPF